MKKLLLFTTLPMIAFLSSFAGKNDVKGYANYNDSSNVADIVSNITNSSSAVVELNPEAVRFVADYKAREGANLNKIIRNGQKHLDVIDQILTKFGIPAELKYLSIIESNLNMKALSWVGARGPWQLMPATARQLGLKVNKGTDERIVLAKSTAAAAKYLNQLFSQYNDWLLVIAAYNCGPGNVNKAIRKSGSKNFWALQNYLPAESRNHVKRFIATHYILEGNGSIATMTKAEANAFFNQADETTIETDETMDVLTVTGKYNSTAIAENIGMSITEFNQLNPAFDKQLSVNGTYNLRLPAEKMESFQSNKNQILDQTIATALAVATK